MLLRTTTASVKVVAEAMSHQRLILGPALLPLWKQQWIAKSHVGGVPVGHIDIAITYTLHHHIPQYRFVGRQVFGNNNNSGDLVRCGLIVGAFLRSTRIVLLQSYFDANILRVFDTITAVCA